MDFTFLGIVLNMENLVERLTLDLSWQECTLVFKYTSMETMLSEEQRKMNSTSVKCGDSFKCTKIYTGNTKEKRDIKNQNVYWKNNDLKILTFSEKHESNTYKKPNKVQVR